MNLPRFFLAIICIFSLCSGANLYAQIPNNQTLIEQRIHQLKEDEATSPAERLSKLELYITEIKENKWTKSLLLANTLKIENLILLEQFVEAEELLIEYLPKTKQANKADLVLRLELALLQIEDVKGVSDKLLELRTVLVTKAKLEKNKTVAASIYMGLGISEYFENNYGAALAHYKKAYELQIQGESKTASSDVLNSLANIYLDLDDIEKAKEYYKQALVIDRANNNQFSESIVLYNLGKTHLISEEYQKAKKVFNQSLALSISLEDDIGVKWAQFSLGEVSVKEKQWQQAIDYYSDVAKTFAQSGDTRMYFDSLMGIVQAQVGLGNLSAAEYALNLAQPLLNVLNKKDYEAAFSKRSSEFYYAKGEYKKAFEQQEIFIKQKEQVYIRHQSESTQKYRVQFDTELKENENRVLSKENELNSLKISQQQQQRRYGVLVIVLAVTIILIVVFMLHKQIQHRNRFKAMALRDHLTSSPNRRAILQYAKERFLEAQSTQMELSVGIIDLDHFKKVNDTYGHDTGDEVLKSFAVACNKVIRKQDRFGRYGGEEWLLVLSDTNKDNIQIIFERLHTELNNSKIIGLPQDENITFSMGIAQYNYQQDKSLQSLINRADECLYQAKSAGRNQLKM